MVRGQDSRVMRAGLRVLARAIREEPKMFTVAALGGSGFGLLTVAGALLVGKVVGRVVVPALDSGHTTPAALGLGAAAVIGLSLLKVCTIFARRLGAGAMQFRLQAAYR